MNENREKQSDDGLIVYNCQDFDINGKGDNAQWNKINWIYLSMLDQSEAKFETKFKILYSSKGIYVLSFCQDNLISTDYRTDQGDIWNGDVFEVFLHFDTSHPLYFEYEINPLNTELAILVPNNEGNFFGWLPWHYEGERKIKRAVDVQGGNPETGSKVASWTAEMFFPYELFKGFKNMPPKPGTEWKGNFYRMDYDTGKQIKWSWKPIDKTFHEYKKFGSIVFK